MHHHHQAYPLQWPTGWKRTEYADIQAGRFSEGKAPLTVIAGEIRVLSELEKLGVEIDTGIVISSNVPQNKDGTMKGNAPPPVDAGVAVYFTFDGEAECIAADLYHRVADNLAAIAATIDAMRTIQRHGGATILRRAFAGFKQLPSASSPGATMGVQAAWDTLARLSRKDMPSAAEQDRPMATQYVRSARMATHPDRGGSAGDFQLVQVAAETLSAYYGVNL